MTAQMPDKIRWNGRSYDLCTLPLEILFLAQGRRPAFEMIHTANYRGYWAQWRLPRGKLVLGGLEPNFTEDRTPIDYDDPEPISEMMTKLREQHESTVKLLNELAAIQDRDRIVPPETIEISEENGFVEDDSGARIDIEALLRAKEQPVFASWYSGLLRLQEGKPVRDWHSNFLTTTEREIIIEIRNGIAQQHWIIDNAQAANEQEAAMWSLLGFRPRLAPDGIQQAQRLLSDPLNSQWDGWKRLFYGNDYLWPQRDGFSPPVIEALLVLIRSHMGDALRSEPVLSKADQSAREQFEWHRSSISSAASRYRRGEVGGDFAVPQDSSLALEWALQQLRSAEEHVEQRRYKLLRAAAHIVQSSLPGR